MFRLTRQVRFSLNDRDDDQLAGAAANGFGGFPAHTGFGQFICLNVTLEGTLDARSSYLRNIREIDQAVRQRVIGHLARVRSAARDEPALPLGDLPTVVFAGLRDLWPGPPADRVALAAIELFLTPTLSLTQHRAEFPMTTRLSQKFEFSASHRLHNPQLDDAENRKLYGKCNNPHGHGHNYELQVTLRGTPRAGGLLVAVPVFERIVQDRVISRLDHRNLNAEVPEFAELIPSVENIAMVIYRMLKDQFAGVGADLASVAVWETPKTWCEYSE